MRNASQDPRLPRLSDDDAAVGSFGYLLQPWALGANGWWDFWTEFTKLKPNTTYTVMMVRYGLKVNGTLDAADSLPIAANDVKPFNLPTYNYNVVVEGKGTDASPVPTGAHAVRFQVGHDLDLNGNPIPNALAPFPTAKKLLVETTLEFTGAWKLVSGSEYRLWAYNSADPSKSIPLVGDWKLLNEDGVAVDSAKKVSGIRGGGGPRDRNTFAVPSDTWGGDILDFDRIRVTIDPANTTKPGDVLVLDGKFIDAIGQFGTLKSSGTFTFAGGYTYTGEGRGHFFGDELRLALRGLARPPVGYFYEVWLVNVAEGRATSLGELKGPYPSYTSLKEADTKASLAPGGLIPDAALVVDRASLGIDYKAFTHVYVTLSPKARDGLPLQVALQGEIPGQVLGK